MAGIVLHLGHEGLVANVLLPDAEHDLVLGGELLEAPGDVLGGDVEGLGVLKAAALGALGGSGRGSRGGGVGADGAGGDADADEGFRDAVELGADGPHLLDAVDGVLEAEVLEVGVSVEGGDDVLPLVNVRYELVWVVLEEEDWVAAAGVDVGIELVLDALPGGEVGCVLVAVLPDGAPGAEDGAGGGAADLVRGGEAALEDAAGHEGVGVAVEGVELGGDVGLGVDVGRGMGQRLGARGGVGGVGGLGIFGLV